MQQSACADSDGFRSGESHAHGENDGENAHIQRVGTGVVIIAGEIQHVDHDVPVFKQLVYDTFHLRSYAWHFVPGGSVGRGKIDDLCKAFGGGAAQFIADRGADLNVGGEIIVNVYAGKTAALDTVDIVLGEDDTGCQHSINISVQRSCQTHSLTQAIGCNESHSGTLLCQFFEKRCLNYIIQL